MAARSVDVEAGDCSAAIHDPGPAATAIQPHGCMLVCTMPGWIVAACSSNCAVLLRRPTDALLGRPLDEVLPHQLVHDLRNVLQTAMGSARNEHLLGIEIDDVGRFDLSLHIAGQQAVIELIPCASGSAGPDAGLLIRSMVGRLTRATTLERSLTVSAHQVRAVSGFDRVLILRWAADGTGQVVAEAIRTGLPSFLGLVYQMSDLPNADQALYRRAGLRAVPDTACEPIPLHMEPIDGSVPDLALALLRGVDKHRLSDLDALGARASLTIPLTRGEDLWGLIACHHGTPRALPASLSTMLDLYGQILSMQIALKEADAEHRASQTVRAGVARLTEHLRSAPFDAGFVGLVRELIACDAVGLRCRGHELADGTMQDREAWDRLFAELFPDPGSASVAVQGPASAAQERRGCLAVRLCRHTTDGLVLFRSETIETVVWGLDPDRRRPLGPDGAMAGPAGEGVPAIRRGRSRPWSEADLQAAELIRAAMLEALLAQAEQVP